MAILGKISHETTNISYIQIRPKTGCFLYSDNQHTELKLALSRLNENTKVAYGAYGKQNEGYLNVCNAYNDEFNNLNSHMTDENKDPYFKTLFQISSKAKGGYELKLQINEIISSMGRNTSEDVANDVYLFHLIRRVCETRHVKMNDDQLEKIAFHYYKTYPNSLSIFTIDIDKNFRIIANMHLNELKLIAPKISSKLGLNGIRKEIFDKHLILVNIEDVKWGPFKQLSLLKNIRNSYISIKDAFEILQPIKSKYLLKSVQLGTRKDFSFGSQRETPFTINIELSGTLTSQVTEILKNRLQKDVGKWEPEEMFTSGIFHEYGHTLQFHSTTIHDILYKIFNTIGPINDQKENNFLGDYSPYQGTKSFAPDEYEFGSVYIEAILKNSNNCTRIALKRANEGNYATLAMVLLTLGSLSAEQNTINIFQSNALNGKASLRVESIQKNEFIKNIPTKYLNAIVRKYGFSINDYINAGLLR